MKVKINKQYFLLFLSAIFTFMLMMSCKEETNITESNSMENKSLSKDIGVDMIQPFVNEIIVWKLDHYETKPGKILGIWPDDSRKNYSGFFELRTKWGFNYIFYSHSNSLPNQFNQILQAGYSRNNIMAGSSVEYLEFTVDNFPNVYAYYIDEPVYHNWMPSGVREYINANSPASLLLIGEFCDPENYILVNNWINIANVNGIFFTGYKRFYRSFLWGWTSFPSAHDQRETWDFYKEKLDWRSRSNWIGTHEDHGEYHDLLQKANTLGMNEIWLYQLQNGSNAELEGFCDAAWSKGWLKKTERKYIYVYHCYEINYEDCDNNPGSWVLFQIIETDEYRITQN